MQNAICQSDPFFQHFVSFKPALPAEHTRLKGVVRRRERLGNTEAAKVRQKDVKDWRGIQTDLKGRREELKSS
jgi:hypothetical protein